MKKYILIVIVIFLAIVSVIYWRRIHNIFLGGCGSNSFSDSTGHCFYANRVHLQIAEGTSRQEVEDIISSIGGVIDEGALQTKNNYVIYFPTIQNKEEQEEIIKKLFNLSSEVEDAYPVSHTFVSPNPL